MKKIVTLIIVLLIITIGLSIYKQIKKDLKIKRVECQEKTITFEKLYKKESVGRAIQLLQTHNYLIHTNIEYSKFMKSNLVNHLNQQQNQTLFESVLLSYLKEAEPSKEKLVIDYYIYENDKEDKGKKQDGAKKYAGYLVFEFKLNKQVIYKIQTDYMKLDGSDISERMECVMKSFTTLKGE